MRLRGVSKRKGSVEAAVQACGKRGSGAIASAVEQLGVGGRKKKKKKRINLSGRLRVLGRTSRLQQLGWENLGQGKITKATKPIAHKGGKNPKKSGARTASWRDGRLKETVHQGRKNLT